MMSGDDGIQRTEDRRGRGDGVIALAVSAAALAALIGTSRDIAMGFDESFTIRREIVLADWFARLANAPGPLACRNLFSRPVLEESWRFSRAEPDGHPPFYALLGLAGWYPTRGRLDPLTTYRFGPMVLTAITCGALAFHLSRRHGRLAGLAAPLLLLTMPRTFTHAHYAHYDMPVTCLWLLAQVAFVNSLRSARWAVGFGLLLGLAAATKFTGWFAAAPALAWAILFEWLPALAQWLRGALTPGTVPRLLPRRTLTATRCLLIGLPVAALVLYAIQPPWWSAPIWGVSRFLASNLSRERTVPVSSLYLGKIYPFALPWHNTIVLTAITTPVLTQVLAGLGLAFALTRLRRDPSAMIWPLSWATLMIVRALPNAPGHDVERLLLPSLPSLAVLAALGVNWLARALARTRAAFLPYALLAGALAESALGFAQYYPYNLSYYNLAVGGLPGAMRLGFEPTYYWDTLGPEFARWADEQARRQPGPLELRLPFNELSVGYLRDWGMLPANVRISGLDPTERPYYIAQHNPGVYADWDWVLEREGRPAFTIRRQGVDLLRVYSFDEAFRAFQATTRPPAATRAGR